MSIRAIEVPTKSRQIERRRLSDMPARVVEGDPQHEYQTTFESADGDFSTGVWTSTPGKWRAFSDRDEFCYIVEGHIRLIGDDGHAQTFRAGDAFVIPNGFVGFWEVVERTTKYFAIRTYKRPQVSMKPIGTQ